MRAVLFLLFALAGLSLSAPAHAGQLTMPTWVEKPSAGDLSRYYPEAAQRRGMGGRVKMSCTVAIGGTLEDCEVLSEYPAGFGFGDAALALSRQFSMRPMIRGGQPVESRVVIPLTFRPPLPASWSASAPGHTPPASPWSMFLPILVFGGWLSWVGWVWFYTPASDPLRIRRDYAPPTQVTSIIRAGTRLGGRYQPSYRLYNVTIQAPGQAARTLRLGVTARLFGDPAVKEFPESHALERFAAAAGLVVARWARPVQPGPASMPQVERPATVQTGMASRPRRPAISAAPVFAHDIISGGPASASPRRSFDIGGISLQALLGAGVVLTILAGLVLIGTGPITPARDGLRQAYGRRPVALASFRGASPAQACGVYIVQGDPRPWRYLGTPAGVLAQGLSNDWRDTAAAPQSAASLDQRWRDCMNARPSGGGFESLVLPLALWIENQT